MFSRKGQAFTLIEILIVIAIIGLLATVIIASMSGAKLRAQDARRIEDIAAIKKALEVYMASNARYPDSLLVLTQGSDHLLSDVPKDPSGDPTRAYQYATSSDATDFVLKAQLSTKDRALNYDLDVSKYGISCNGDDTALVGPYDYCVSP